MVGRCQFTVLSDAELQNAKDRMEQLLEERGVHLDHDAMLKDLAAAGCEVDMEAKDVKFPKAVIDKAIAAVPAEFTLYSPSGEYDLKFPHPEGNFYTRTNTGAPNYRTIDGQQHFVKKDEVVEWYKITNALEELSFVTLPSTSGEEVAEEAVDVWTLAEALKRSKKHIWVQPYEQENVKYLCELAATFCGGYDKLRERPLISMIACSVPCLTYKPMDAEILYLSAKYGIPVQPCSLPTAGANTPVTAVGTAFVACTEVFAQIVMLELLCPGLPVIATPLLFSMDMLSTYTLQSNTEITIARSIAMEIFENGYNIRCHSYGTGTDSIALDAQNFIERTSLTHSMALSAASVLGGLGQLETAKTISPIQGIIDNEIFAIAKRIRRGLAFSDEIIDWDELIAGVDKDPAYSYLMSMHTMDHYEEAHRPDMFNREGLPKWEAEGKKTLTDKALEKFHDIISAAGDGIVIDADLAAKIDKVCEDATEKLIAFHKSQG